MKRKKLVLLSLLMAGSLMASMPVYAEDGETNPVIPEEEIIKNDETGIPDKALYDLVLKEGDGFWGNKDGILTKEEAKKINMIQILDDSYDEISSLKGIGFCENLTDLSIYSKNQITDLSPLRELKLNGLDIYLSQISDLSHLTGMNSLQRLNIGYSKISDITPVATLTNLESLALIGNQVSDISALGGLKKLRYLELMSNKISDISVVKDLTNLTELGLADNQISDISPVSNLTNLYMLRVQRNNITKLPDLHKLTKLYPSSMGGGSDEEMIENLYVNFRGNQIKLSDAKANLPEQLISDKLWLENQNFIADAVVTDAKTQLQNKITVIENEKLDETKYTKESWKAFADALAKAKSVLADPASTEESYKSALNELTTARNNLVENKKEVQVNPVKSDSASKTDGKTTEVKSAVPRTGDSNNIWLMLVMTLGSAVVVVIMGYRRKVK